MQQPHDLECSLQGQRKEDHLSYFKAIPYHNKYLIAIYDVSGIFIFYVDFKGHPR